SGTRVWLEAQLQRLGISPASIRGYGAETATHTEVARAVAAGQADAGLGLEAAALAYGLDFIFLTRERYDLVLLRETAERLPASAFLEWLSGAEPRQWIRQLGGYDLSESGTVYHIN
ncbi:MAG TPA: substrate-binding domain-containing protein, partial [Anaerolineaceae bacterium]|nr:substrate-binding domain-containing protein [Anaerolineaceae bacterium]